MKEITVRQMILRRWLHPFVHRLTLTIEGEMKTTKRTNYERNSSYD